jgi:signal transduction histidine kinase
MTIAMITDYLSHVVPPTEPDGAAMIEDLRAAVERANRVISEMLEFARPAALSLKPDDFHMIAERALGLVRHEITRKRLQVVCDWHGPAPKLLLDRNKLEQALVNLLLNAIQATPEKGTLTLRSRDDASGFTAEIDDTGTGVSASHQSKLFEPFFTTKPVGQGTGLGLSVARQIIQLHGGTLRLANRPEGGARVTIHIRSN